MKNMMRLSLISGVFLSGLPVLAMTGCSNASSEPIATIEGLSPGEYRDKLQQDLQKKVAKSGKKARRH